MNKTVLVSVTARDIANGIAFHPGMCPVARALNRAVPVVGGWHVTRARRDGKWYGVATVHHNPTVKARLSQSVGKFTIAFDDGRPVGPFDFRFWR